MLTGMLSKYIYNYLVIIKDWGVRLMSPGSLSLIAKYYGDLREVPDTRPKIHSFVDCPIQSRLQMQLGCILSMSNATRDSWHTGV